MKKNNIKYQNAKKAFTLIELMVVMTIMAMLTITMYTPFSNYQTKQKVKNSAKIISQSLYEARSNAIYGISSSTGNLDIGVLFKNGEDKIGIYGFPYKKIISNYLSPDSKYLLENIDLEKGVKITSSGGLILYKAITGSGIYNNFTISENMIELSIGYKGATTGPTIKKIDYYTKTYISDVK